MRSYAGSVTKPAKSKIHEATSTGSNSVAVPETEHVFMSSHSRGTVPQAAAIKMSIPAVTSTEETNNHSTGDSATLKAKLDDGFPYLKEHLHHKKRMESHKKVIRRNVNSSGGVRRGPELDRHLFIFCVDKSNILKT